MYTVDCRQLRVEVSTRDTTSLCTVSTAGWQLIDRVSMDRFCSRHAGPPKSSGVHLSGARCYGTGWYQTRGRVTTRYATATIGAITSKTRMVQLPATAAIEYVAACCITRTRTITKTKIGTITKIVPGCLCPFPPSSMLIRTV